MAAQLNPYLLLPGNAAEALAFYGRVFGATPEMTTYAEADPEGAMGPPPDGVMHASLQTPAGALMVSDAPLGTDLTPGNGIAMSLSGDDPALRSWWEQLADGGTVQVPLEKQVWGDEFGTCQDRFGISWMVNISPAGS